MAKKKSQSILTEGSRSINQLMAPSSIAFTSEKELKVENNYVRSFVVNGYPSNVSMGWLSTLYDHDGDTDVVVPIFPANERSALDELTDKIVQYEAQRLTEIDKGSVKNITALESKIKALYEQRARLEQNYENMFHVAVTASLYNHDLKTLDKESQKLQSRLEGKKIGFMPLDLRQDEGWKSTSPFGVNHVNDYYRNVNTGALSQFFPFYSPEVNHPNGTFIGINRDRQTPIIIDFFNRKVLGNANLSIFGVPGSGKTFLVSLLTLRSTLEGIKTVIIDPEGEYKPITESVKGTIVKLAPGSTLTMNPFDIEEEVEVDENDNPTGRVYVDIKGKAADMLNLFGVMFPNLLNEETKADMSELLIQLYHNFGITENPDSLYEEDSKYDEEKDEFFHSRYKKTMPRMSDYRELIRERAEQTNDGKLFAVYKAMGIYTEGGIYDLFDCYTTIEFNYDTTPVLTFDISGIEDDMLRPIAMQVALSWSWNKFVKKDLKTKKRIVCDEAWMLLKKTMAGSDYSSLFLEKCARRIRKYNGSLCVASQNFREFASRDEGLAILSSSAVKIFMKQDSQDLASLGDRFILSDGERGFLLQAQRGEALMKVGMESFIAQVAAFVFEEKLISKKYLKETESVSV